MPEHFLSVSQASEKWNLSPRRICALCRGGKIPGAVLVSRKWQIPADAVNPTPGGQALSPLLAVLRREKQARLSGGIYHRLQVSMAYNSNHMEGNQLTSEQTRLIYETGYLGEVQGPVPVNDILVTVNHFRCLDQVIRDAGLPLTQPWICSLHGLLFQGCSSTGQIPFPAGTYKTLPNTVGEQDTVAPDLVGRSMEELLLSFRRKRTRTLEDVIDFHVRFERIHPFQDGNGRVGRLIALKECLCWGIVPFVLEDDLKYFYYRGLREWDREKGYLRDTILTAQDRFRAWMQFFQIPD